MNRSLQPTKRNKCLELGNLDGLETQVNLVKHRSLEIGEQFLLRAITKEHQFKSELIRANLNRQMMSKVQSQSNR